MLCSSGIAILLSWVLIEINISPKDHVAATFGAGLGVACVVDVGDQVGHLECLNWNYQTVLQKTSISCVEDGVSLPSSRIQLGYGGSDVTQLLHYLSRWLLIWVNPVLGYMIHF